MGDPGTVLDARSSDCPGCVIQGLPWMRNPGTALGNGKCAWVGGGRGYETGTRLGKEDGVKQHTHTGRWIEGKQGQAHKKTGMVTRRGAVAHMRCKPQQAPAGATAVTRDLHGVRCCIKSGSATRGIERGFARDRGEAQIGAYKPISVSFRKCARAQATLPAPIRAPKADAWAERLHPARTLPSNSTPPLALNLSVSRLSLSLSLSLPPHKSWGASLSLQSLSFTTRAREPLFRCSPSPSS
eukprot:357047-Chlamydomonas_euryale.AAC.2